MTKTEARQIATSMNAWRRDLSCELLMPATPEEFGIAIDVLTQPSTIAENIRNAAINWPEFLGDVESDIVESFNKRHYGNGACSILAALQWAMPDSPTADRYRIFMLFVAEAIE
jgi:hypothetical protein